MQYRCGKVMTIKPDEKNKNMGQQKQKNQTKITIRATPIRNGNGRLEITLDNANSVRTVSTPPTPAKRVNELLSKRKICLRKEMKNSD